ncbi:MAG: TlpA family protein disulfide reductase [Nitrospira sp.]|nr:TlpA family protein disulfide reductase [Nitrospira sp.]MCP9441782.1 TlpA family protein disulfide reductase [Nitrospira sp.]
MVALVRMVAGVMVALSMQQTFTPEVTAAPSLWAQDDERNVARIGGQAPDFHLQDLRGEVISLSQFRGKVVLLNFWATWCGPCLIEMPALEQLYQRFARRDFEILAISTDPQGAAVTRPFQQERELTFPILHDPDMHVGLTYGVRTLPLSFVVDRRGVIRKKIFGARDWDSPEAHDLIRMLMKS